MACAVLSAGCGISLPITSPAATSSPSPPAAPSACRPKVDGEAREAISAQTAALGRGDFAAARDRASRGYRQRVPLADFIAIISADYAYLLSNPRIVFGDCMVLADGYVLMGVRYEPGDDLMYWLIQQDGQLVIEGAGPVAGGSPMPVPA